MKRKQIEDENCPQCNSEAIGWQENHSECFDCNYEWKQNSNIINKLN